MQRGVVDEILVIPRGEHFQQRRFRFRLPQSPVTTQVKC
jgi:hypothetical protein